MSQDPRVSLLLTHLSAVVPLKMQELQDEPRASLSARLAECGETIAAHGDDLLYGGKYCRATLDSLVEALAILALLQPGGVDFGGLHFEAVKPCAGR